MRSFLFLALLTASPAIAGDKVRVSLASSDTLSTTYSCEAVAAPPGGQGYLLRLEGTLTSISTAASVLWFLAKDSGGDKPITDITTVSIVDHDADAAGGVSSIINTGWVRDTDSGNDLFVCASTDAGTATMVTRLFWEAR